MAGYLEGLIGGAFLKEYYRRVKTEFGDHPLLRDAFCLSSRHTTGREIVLGGNVYSYVLANKILLEQGLRIADYSDILNIRKFNLVNKLLSLPVDSGLVLQKREVEDENSVLAKVLEEQSKGFRYANNPTPLIHRGVGIDEEIKIIPFGSIDVSMADSPKELKIRLVEKPRIYVGRGSVKVGDRFYYSFEEDFDWSKDKVRMSYELLINRNLSLSEPIKSNVSRLMVSRFNVYFEQELNKPFNNTPLLCVRGDLKIKHLNSYYDGIASINDLFSCIQSQSLEIKRLENRANPQTNLQ